MCPPELINNPLHHEQEGRKEGNVLFNDALNIFYLVIWRHIYGKGPFRLRKKTRATLFD